MPISVAYQRNEYGSLFKGLKTLTKRSISFSFTDNARSILRSVSFGGRQGNDSSPKPPQHFERSLIQGFLSFNSRRQMQPFAFETMVSAATPKPEDQPSKSSDEGKVSNSPRLIEADSPKHEAALRLQKVYKSFRTRRQLADCAIIIEQQWWNLVDVALLKRNSVSFFNVEKKETVVSRWSRARRKAAQVGKGLSKDAKAQKLALQHWLEAIDPRHRYGHNLNFYYDHWLQCKSNQPFFYWLDVGEGKEINLQEQCNRSKLQQECIMYLGLREREAYQVIVEDGKFMYKNSGEIINTCDSPEDKKWIFVLSTSRNLYIGQKARGRFQHSSFLAGGATSAAGRIVIEHGVLKAVWPHSGHYRPTNTNFQEFMNFLHEKGVDLSNVRTNPSDGDDAVGGLISCPSADFTNYIPQTEAQLPHHASAEETTTANAAADTELIGTEITASSQQVEATEGSNNAKSIDEEEQEQEQDGEQVLVPSDSLLRRIKSKKEMKTYQLGNSLTFKWAAGTGPRIACVRDYPSELQFRALEQVSLSPRGPCPLPSAILTPRHSRLSRVNETCTSS